MIAGEVLVKIKKDVNVVSLGKVVKKGETLRVSEKQAELWTIANICEIVPVVKNVVVESKVQPPIKPKGGTIDG